MRYSVRAKLRHDPGVLGRCHIALVAAFTAFYNSPAMDKVDAEGERMVQLLMKRDPEAADAFMDRLFVRTDLPAAPFDFKEDDEEKADVALQAYFDKVVAEWMSGYEMRISDAKPEADANG